jgi:8-oxo-dGTP pyrophosphatase MutT (NUDIX family)
MVVRDRTAGSGDSGGLEVLMLRKDTRVDFAAGAYVFPGGALDEVDSSAEVEELATGRNDASASEQLGVASGGIAFWVAAVRECFEEAGLLLARARNGEMVSFQDPDEASRFEEYRRRMNEHSMTLWQVCRTENLTLALDRLHYFSHWITPEGAPRRYDTRFFVAEAPAGQVAGNDGHETVESRWVSPEEALAEGRRGNMSLIYATMKNLEAISRFSSAGELIAHARAIESVPANLPRIHVEGREIRIMLPGDPGYEILESFP